MAIMSDVLVIASGLMSVPALWISAADLPLGKHSTSFQHDVQNFLPAVLSVARYRNGSS